MTKLILTILTLFFITSITIGQNIVINSSFEDTVYCPDISTSIEYSQGWSSYQGTPDYFNTCSTDPNYSVPNNGWGIQNSFSGNAYAGFWAYYHPHSPNGREFIGRELATPMIIGQNYFISINFSLSDLANCAINNIGICFSTEPHSWISSPDSINNSPQFYTNNIIIDKVNWTTISGWFTADSAYQFMAIGNYFNDDLTDTIILDTPQFYGYGAYYFVDDICISVDSTTCPQYANIIELSDKNNYKIFPNPANQFALLEFLNSKNENYTFELYDINGQLLRVIEGIKTNKLKVERQNLEKGMYFFKLLSDKKMTLTGKLIFN